MTKASKKDILCIMHNLENTENKFQIILIDPGDQIYLSGLRDLFLCVKMQKNRHKYALELYEKSA